MAAGSLGTIRTVETRQGTVQVRDTGSASAGSAESGTPLLLLHALLVNGEFYSRLVPLLTAQGHRCIVPELPLGSHPLPMNADADLTPTGLAQLIVDVLDALNIAKVDLVGVDTGGALSQLLMAWHRDRVGRVVLTGCDAYESFPPRSFKFLVAPLKLPGALFMTAQGARLRVMRKLGTVRPLTHAKVDDAIVKSWTRPLLTRGIRRDLRKVLVGIKARYTLDAAAANADFPNPVLLAWGDDDRLFSRKLAERLVADLPQARLTTLEDCAAFAALDQPERLAALIHEHVSAPDEAVITLAESRVSNS
jgi:pimeloyl-ACP methyl ester carboxylesterase